jgi:hypothetical protein
MHKLNFNLARLKTTLSTSKKPITVILRQSAFIGSIS